MDDIALSDPALELLPESQKRFDGIIGSGFYLDWVHLILGLAVIGDDKIDLNIVAPFFLVVMGIEEQTVSVSSQHLSNHILIEHTFIQSKLAPKNLLIDLILQ